MSLIEQTQALVQALAQVPGIGRVHAYERYGRSEREFRDLFVAQIDGLDQLRGWWLRRTGTTERSPGIGRTSRTHAWHLTGYMALEDAAQSELVFQDLIEAICSVLREFPPVLDAVYDREEETGVQVQDVQPMRFAGVLCHGATLTFKTHEFI